MTTNTKIETVTVREDTTVSGYGIFEAGEYSVEMPVDYDPELVTAEDIVHDNMLRVVED